MISGALDAVGIVSEFPLKRRYFDKRKIARPAMKEVLELSVGARIFLVKNAPDFRL